MLDQTATFNKNIELALAREALRLALKQLREQKIEVQFLEAANDPLYMQDLENCMKDWAAIDRDSLQYLPIEPYEEV